MNALYLSLLLVILTINYVQGTYNNIRTLAATNVISYNKHYKYDSNKMATVNDSPLKIVSRIPRSLYIGTFVGIESFIETALVMLPIGMLLKFGLLKQGLKLWIKEGSKLGLEWGTLSGVFSGTENFIANVRQKKDRWNSYIGSGMASACMRAGEGPKGIIMNFCIGFAFMYIIDMIVPATVPTIIEQTAVHETTTKISNKISQSYSTARTKTLNAQRFIRGKHRNSTIKITNFIKKFL